MGLVDHSGKGVLATVMCLRVVYYLCRSPELSPDRVCLCSHCKSSPAVSQPSRNFFLYNIIILCACAGFSVLSLSVYFREFYTWFKTHKIHIYITV